MGFGSIREWADAGDEGRTHLTTFRKAVGSAVTATGDYVDYTYFPGNPPANFYASAPLVSALVEADKGLRIPDVDEQFVKSLTVMSAASSATATGNQNQTLQLLDYLMYYPFIDTDAVGEVQAMTQTATLPRGAGKSKTAENRCLNTDFKLGTVAGSPGTPPTYWGASNPPTGCTREIDFGTDAYGDYFQVRYYGTNTSGSTSYPSIIMGATYNPSVAGDVWSLSSKIALMDGAWPSSGAYMQIFEYTSGGAYLVGGTSLFTSLVTGATPVFVSMTRSMKEATAGLVAPSPASFTINNGETVDFTVRVYEPMFTKTASPCPYAKSTTTNGVAEWESYGEGVRVMAVSQSAAPNYGSFHFRYTNQDGIPNRWGGNSAGYYAGLKACNGGGTLLTYNGGSSSSFPFIFLQHGDTGIRSIESVTIYGSGGGLMALVLVKPLMTMVSGEECRVSTGTVESFGSASQIESVIHRTPPKIERGAVLGLIGCGNNGSLASSILAGVLETQWST